VRRREFITLLGGAAVGWPTAARAQQQGKVPTIGLLGAAAASVWRPWTDAFVQRLGELGWVDGRTVMIEYRWADGRPERFGEIADEFVRRNVDVIVTAESAAAAVKQATATIPIIIALGTDPVAAGLVASLSRPGGNVTGLSNVQIDLAPKRLELLREVVPNLRRLAILANVSHQASVLEMDEVKAAARKLGIAAASMEIRHAEDIAPAFETLKGQADALYVVLSALVAAVRTRIITFALSARLPTSFNARAYVEAGALMSYGPDFVARWRRAAEIVDKVLRGAKPADIPVEQPTKFELVINLSTAKALGLTVPPTLLARADEVIE
jgi:putative ABC transport system substrate-binding protein